METTYKRMKKKNELVVRGENQMSPEQIDLIKRTVAKDATDTELQLFLYTAKRTGLDALTKQIHFVKRAGQMTIQTGIDGYRAIAERTKTLAGIDDAIYDSETNQHPNKATVTVWRNVNGQKVGFTASARWTEYAPQGNQAFMWNKMPYLMLGKCAEALALRKAFPHDLSGLYTHEEMAQAGNPSEYDTSEVDDNAVPTVVGVDDVPSVQIGETFKTDEEQGFTAHLDDSGLVDGYTPIKTPEKEAPKIAANKEGQKVQIFLLLRDKFGVDTKDAESCAFFVQDQTGLTLEPKNYIAIIKKLHEKAN